MTTTMMMISDHLDDDYDPGVCHRDDGDDCDVLKTMVVRQWILAAILYGEPFADAFGKISRKKCGAESQWC